MILILLLLLCSLALPQEKPPEWLPEGPESSDEADPVRFNGLIQLQVDDGHRGNRDRGSSLPTLGGISAFPADTSVTLRRLRLSMTARLAEELDFVVQGHFDSRDEEANLRDCYLRYRVNDDLTLQAGQFKMRWGWEGYRSAAETNTIERSDATRALYQGRDLGLNLGGRNGKLEWDVGVFAGQRLEFADRDSRRDLAARLVWHFNENLQVGASVQNGSHVPEGTSVSQAYTRADGEFAYHSGPWTVEAEVMYGDGFNFYSQADTLALGGYVSTVYRLDEEWDLVLQLDAFDPALGMVDETFPDNGLNARSRVVLGANYYIARKPEHRFMLNYELNQQWEAPSFPQNGFRARYQFRF